MEGQIRVLKDTLEMRLEVQISSNHNILSWLVEFAGTVVNRYEVGRDGKTPYERLRGKQLRLIGFEFGEKVNFRRTAVGARMEKLDSLWSDGVFPGYPSISGEIVVGTKNGVFTTRTVQRKAYEHRWGKENLDMVGGVPWKSTPDEASDRHWDGDARGGDTQGADRGSTADPSQTLYQGQRHRTTRCHCELQGLHCDVARSRRSASH